MTRVGSSPIVVGVDGSADRTRPVAGAACSGRRLRWLGWSLVAIALGAAANSLLGPLLAGVVRYPVSESLRNQTLGLEAFSLLVVAPLALVAGVLALRNRPVSALLGLAPAGYLAYMLVQYIVGPDYLAYPAVLPLHLGLFVLSGATVLQAWAVSGLAKPSMPRRTRRIWAVVVFACAAFVTTRYAGIPGAVLRGDAIPAESRGDPGMYWSIVLLDLGVVVPVAVATGVGLLRGARWAVRALCGVVGWFALVPPSVAAMGAVMLARGDTNTSTGHVVVLIAAALAFGAVAAALFAGLARTEAPRRR